MLFLQGQSKADGHSEKISLKRRKLSISSILKKYSPFPLYHNTLHSMYVVWLSLEHWLAHLVERRTAAREVEGSCPRPDQHSGS